MNIRAILLDFDGTSLQKDQVYLPIRNMKALRRAMDKGVEVIPCTGRVQNMQPPQIEAEPRIRYLVTSSGSRVVDRVTGEVIYEDVWTPEESALLCRIFEGQQIYSEIAAVGKIFMEQEIIDHLENYPVPPHHVWFMELGRQIGVDKFSDYFISHGIGMEKVNIYGIPVNKQISIHKQILESDLVHMTDPAGANIQFFPKTQDREKATDVLLKKLGIPYAETLCIGDSGLDVPTIKAAGIGVAVGNAPDWVKAAADYVTDDFDKDGLAKALDKFIP